MAGRGMPAGGSGGIEVLPARLAEADTTAAETVDKSAACDDDKQTPASGSTAKLVARAASISLHPDHADSSLPHQTWVVETGREETAGRTVTTGGMVQLRGPHGGHTPSAPTANTAGTAANGVSPCAANHLAHIHSAGWLPLLSIFGSCMLQFAVPGLIPRLAGAHPKNPLTTAWACAEILGRGLGAYIVLGYEYACAHAHLPLRMPMHHALRLTRSSPLTQAVRSASCPPRPRGILRGHSRARRICQRVGPPAPTLAAPAHQPRCTPRPGPLVLFRPCRQCGHREDRLCGACQPDWLTHRGCPPIYRHPWWLLARLLSR